MPRQARSQATCRAVLEAAARILVSSGPAAVTTNALADLAGVSIGSLYRYFPGKEAIFAELVRAMRAAMLVDLRAAAIASAGQDPGRSVHILLAASVAHHRTDPGRIAAIETVEKHPALDEESLVLKAEISALFLSGCSPPMVWRSPGAPHAIWRP